MQNKNRDLLQDVADYYTGKLDEFGETPQGVDWNGEESQNQRFIQLCKIIHKSNKFTINDLGCGYGGLLDFLKGKYSIDSYCGFDVSSEMVRAAQARHIGYSNTRFITAAEPDVIADYGVASGIFNVRLGRTDEEWHEYLKKTLETLNKTSRMGFAFNCLTSYSDEDKKKDYLFYANPCELFDLCKRRYSRQVAILHDYGLYEFTILVRKDI